MTRDTAPTSSTTVPLSELCECQYRLDTVIALSSDWYWELDKDDRFTAIKQPRGSAGEFDISSLLGKTWPEIGAIPVEGDWEDYQFHLVQRPAFKDFLVRYSDPKSGQHYIQNSGVPRFDNEGRFSGCLGISKDVTYQYRGQQLLGLEHAVTKQLAEADDIAAAMSQVMRIICECEDWMSGVYFEALDDSGTVRVAEEWTSPNANSTLVTLHKNLKGLVLSPRADMIGEVYKKKQLVWIADAAMHTPSSQRDMFRATGLHASLGAPIILQDRIVGIFGFASAEIREPDPRFAETLTIICSQIAQFIQRKRSELILRANEQRFRSLIQFSSDWYWEQDENFQFTEVVGNTVKGSPADFVGKTLWDTQFHGEPMGITWDEQRRLMNEHQPFHDLIVKNRLADGRIIFHAVSGQPLFDADGRFTGYRGVGRNVTEQKQTEERIQYLARHDALTGLMNRSMFSEMLQHSIDQARRFGHCLAVLFIDLDRFKNINDTLGHGAGDTLLKEVAQRLTDTLRTSDVVARLGGDEFVVLVPQLEASNDVATVARKILSAVTRPMFLLGQECRVTASIGISQYPADAQDEPTLMKNADIAMYRAKEEGKNTFKFYSEDLKTQSLERLALETSLRLALERQEFLLHYQAKRDLVTKRITGVEALLRWNHPDLGMVSPAQFIPLAEETGLIVPIGKWVLNTACAQNMAWQHEGLPPLSLAVNLSARQFADENLLKDIADALDQSGMSPSLLELELTESMVMQNYERAAKVLAAIKDMGIRLAIDDFGVGYSSLAQIKNFPIDTLKVDRSFIRDLPGNAEDCAITKAIIAMGKTLSLTVVAEGVETEEQEQFLRNASCDQAQGYFFNRPIPAEQLKSVLSDMR